MSYKVLPTKEFSKDFKKLDKQEQKRIKSKIKEVAQNPVRCKHLHYDLSDSCRLRIGKIRVLFSYDIDREELYLEKVIFRHKYKK
jgi:mRNA-degrading endonuclease RelE of RelBE toxin-antitoxin system